MDVVNLRNEETVPHPLCLLRVVGCDESSTVGTVYNQTEDNGNQVICPVQQGGFNALLLLLEGTNELRITCGKEEIVRCIIYKPLINSRFVRLVYITCLNEEKFQGPPGTDRSPNGAVKRIRTGALVLQMFVAETLASEGLGRKTFRLEMDTKGRPKVHIIQLPLTLREAHRFSEERLWETVALQILSSQLADKNCKYIAFFSGTRYNNQDQQEAVSETEIISMTKGHVSLGGGGLALVGTGALYTWATDIPEVVKCFSNSTVTNKSLLMDFSAGRGTLGASYGTHLGSVLHELAHTFDVGHTPHGIMARGFEDLHIFFTSTRLRSDYLPQSPHHKSVLRQSMSSSLIKESVTFTTDFISKNPLDNINMTVEPPTGPLASSSVCSPPSSVRRLGCCSTPKDKHGKDLVPSEIEALTPPHALRSTCGRVATNGHSPMHVYHKQSSKLQAEKGIKCRAFWARSSAVLLAFHKWFNNLTEGDKPELKGSVLCSSAGIRSVELRDLHTMAFHHWEYVSRPPPPVLHVPWAQVPHWPSDSQIEVVAQDDSGNILKGCFIPRPL